MNISIDTIFGIGGTLLGIWGIYLAIKANKKVTPFYDLRNVSLIGHATRQLNKFQLLFNGKSLDDAAILKVVFWNAGNKTLVYEDVPKNSSFAITINDGEILEAEVIYQSHLYNGVELDYETHKGQVIITFDFFEPKEGLVLKVIHTGKSSKNISVDGKFKGANPLETSEEKPVGKFGLFILATMLIFFIIVSILKFSTNMFEAGSLSLKISIGISAILMGITIIVSVSSFIDTNKKRIPKTLGKNYYDT